MPYIKSEEERKIIKEGGKIVGEILADIQQDLEPGVNLSDIDKEVESRIIEAGGSPVFKGYQPDLSKKPFPHAICASVNEEVVHGFADDYELQEGDLVSIDVGMEWPVEDSSQHIVNPHSEHGGYITDTAFSKIIGENEDKKAKELLNTTQKALYKAIDKARVGNAVAEIGKTVEEIVKPKGFGIVRRLCGHGVGHKIHEEPNVFNFHTKQAEEQELKEGAVIAIEPMLTVSGNHEVTTGDNEWSIVTEDGSLSAHFEHTIIVESDGPVIATKREGEEIL
ncbi:MAG: type I methionyl aminopeptidase [Candidatus Magasanikbacteria bacterium]